MKTICAWCRNEIMDDSHTAESLSDDAISHGICTKCQNNIKFQKGASLQEYIDAFDAPILAADAEGAIIAANQLASALVKKEIPRMNGHLLGDVFECVHARLPEGCGRTIHCSGCAIRQSVLFTFTTGTSCVNIPATLKYESTLENAKITFILTTQKVLDMVLLRIDNYSADGVPFRQEAAKSKASHGP